MENTDLELAWFVDIGIKEYFGELFSDGKRKKDLQKMDKYNFINLI